MMIQTGHAEKILIVCSEHVSLGLPKDNPEAATLFSDGSAAVVLSAQPGKGRKFTYLTGTFCHLSEGI